MTSVKSDIGWYPVAEGLPYCGPSEGALSRCWIKFTR
jgi:hypothetical protein